MGKKDALKSQDDLEQAASILKKGGVVIFPTDTCYGIGCRMDDEKAIERVYQIKERPADQPTLVVVSDYGQLEQYVQDVPRSAKNLMNRYWPGPVTLVLKCKVEKVPKMLRGGKETLGFRLPNYPPLISLIKKVGVPLLAPSANFRGEPPPKSFGEIDKNFAKLADFVLKDDGLLGVESTIVDCTKIPPKILRSGSVKIKLL